MSEAVEETPTPYEEFLEQSLEKKQRQLVALNKKFAKANPIHKMALKREIAKLTESVEILSASLEKYRKGLDWLREPTRERDEKSETLGDVPLEAILGGKKSEPGVAPAGGAASPPTQRPAVGTPVSRPTVGTPVSMPRPVVGTPVSGTARPVVGTPAATQRPIVGTPVSSITRPPVGTPVASPKPAEGTPTPRPTVGTPVGARPVVGTPIGNRPTVGTPVSRPMVGTPISKSLPKEEEKEESSEETEAKSS